MNFTGIEMLHRPHAKGSPTLISQFSASLRLVGELLASAFARTLHSYHRSIPDTLIVPTAADGSWCVPLLRAGGTSLSPTREACC